MRDTEKDLDELERLLGRAKLDYRALRHGRRLEVPRASPARSMHLRKYALAASVLVVVTVLTLSLTEKSTQPEALPSRPSKLAFSRPQAIPLSLRPEGRWYTHLSMGRPRMTGKAIGLHLPRRPSGSNG